MEHETKLHYKLPALPEPESDTYTPAAFRALVERMRSLLTHRKRREMSSTRDFDIARHMNLGITPGNTTITVTSNLEGFDYEYCYQKLDADYLCIRVCLYNTYIASVVATPTSLRFYNDGWQSMTTSRRMSDVNRWFRRLFGCASPYLRNNITVSQPVTRNQYAFLEELAAPNKIITPDGKKWYSTYTHAQQDECIAVVLGNQQVVTREMQDVSTSGAWATAERRLRTLGALDDNGGLYELRIGAEDIEDSRVLMLAASVPGITVEDSDVVIPREAWENKLVWNSIPEEVLECLPEYKVEQQAFGRKVWHGTSRQEPVTRRMLINANKYFERNFATVEITAA